GENVARSGTFLSSVIHESLMNSPDHRENVLDPRFDEVGIGVVRDPDRTYYVTQDFIQSLDLKDEPESLDFLLRRIQDVRAPMSLPPLAWVDEVSASARGYARARATGHVLRAVPPDFRGSQISFAVGPDLAEIGDLLGKKSAAPFVRGGLGVFFDRTPAYPGGAYYICAILMPASPRGGLGSKELAEVVFRAANSVRRDNNLGPLFVKGTLNRAASAGRKGQDGAVDARSSASSKTFKIVYETTDLTLIPTPLTSVLRVSSFRKIGISVSPVANRWGTVEHFTVAVVLARS
ncbi:MAG: CAP domain-containing protein, partial [Candidatus Aminicenantes bacterium]|nr:CAP domain-containing protein [Candidatus Aminicenantes bacterium]